MTHAPPVEAAVIRTARVATGVRRLADWERGDAVILVHGNVSSSVFFDPLLRHLPNRYRPIAIDLRGFGRTEAAPVDATRGLRDFSDDLLAALDALGIDRAHLVGWSLGGGVVLQAAIDAPGRVATMTLIAPISPFGFGGTHGPDGALNSPDGAGSGAGTVSRRFVSALADGDTGDGPASPRALLRRFYVGRTWEASRPDGVDEETLVHSMLQTTVGPENYPGDVAESEHWPNVAPGARGVMNALAPTHMSLSGIVGVEPKPPVLWIRGDKDVVISDSSAMDIVQRGRSGAIPGYPGAETLPPQPMLTQTRTVFDAYAAAGGRRSEVVIPGAGHAPHLEQLPRVLEVLVPHLDGAVKP